jgi:integrase
MKKSEARKQQPEIEFPYTYTKPKSSVSLKIYKTPRDGYDAFTVVYYKDGERKRILAKSFEAAVKEAEAASTFLGSASGDVLELRSADRASYLRSREFADKAGIPLEVMASRYYRLMQILGDTPPDVAAEYYKKMHPTKLPMKLVKTVIDELLTSKRGDGLSDGYLRHLGYDLAKFNATFNNNIGSITGAEIDAWLRGLNVSGRTRNNLRCSVHTLFVYAKSRRYLARDHDELEAVGRAKNREGEIEIFTPAELVEILLHTKEEIMPFLLVGAFAGVRHIEIQRLTWADVRLDDGLIEIRAKNAKTASRRMIPIVPNLKEWLLEYRKDTGPVCDYNNVGFALHKLSKGINEARRAAWAMKHGKTAEQLKENEAKARKAAKEPRIKRQKREVPPGAETAELEGWTPFAWKHNALRHSFISYRVAQVQDVAKVSLEAGNSPRMVFSNYRELVRSVDAEKWFSITPALVEVNKLGRQRNPESQALDQRPVNLVDLPRRAVA